MLNVEVPAIYKPLPLDMILDPSSIFINGRLVSSLILPLTYIPTPSPPVVSLTALILPAKLTITP